MTGTVPIQRTWTIHGTVTVFDEPVGLGEVQAADGSGYPFHCTAIADGSRNIDVGQKVTFRLVPSRIGRTEAVDLTSR